MLTWRGKNANEENNFFIVEAGNLLTAIVLY